MIVSRSASIALALLLVGCATSPPDLSVEKPAAVGDAEIAEAPATPPETPIPDDSLLPLLQAEFALRQRNFNQGLALLAEQAVLLEDPALARRALRLAEFVNDTDQAAMMAVRLVELDPDDGAAAAAASGWLSRAGRPLDAVYYAQLAFEHGHPVNVATNLGTYDALDEGSQVAITETIRAIAAQWPEDDQAAIAACLLARIEGDLKGAESFILPVLERSPEDVRAVMLWTQLMLDQDADDPFQLLATTVSRYPDNRSFACSTLDCSVQRGTTRVPKRSLFCCLSAILKIPSSSPLLRYSTLNLNISTRR